jgi:hypothetical protein
MSERLEDTKEDAKEDLKDEVAEIKFLIHDLRVESFINEVIHFHVTVNTDLEIYNIDQAQAIHGEDLQELKSRAAGQRKALQRYRNAVTNFSPDKTILEAGKGYAEGIYDFCEMIMNPRWGRTDQVLSFLPRHSRSARWHPHYMNTIRWISGVHTRIRHFMEEKSQDLHVEFDIAEEIQYYVRNVVYGYVTEKSSARVEIQLDRLDSAVLAGNRYRFRRMFFNLVMNAVDAMSQRKLGVLNASAVIRGDRVVLQVRDNGAGMTPEKIRLLLEDRHSLDGELHSLGFVFVRRTIAQFGGEVSIESEVDKGTTVSVSLPFHPGRKGIPPPRTDYDGLDLFRPEGGLRQRGRAAYAKALDGSSGDKHGKYGEIIYADYMISDAQFPGAIFAMGIAPDDTVDYFRHKQYERDWNITHEDLSPMLFEATVRGRLEEEEDRTPVVILKAPQNMGEFFEFRSVPEEDRNPERYIAMVHDEYVRVARKLIATGMSPHTRVRLTDLKKFFPRQTELAKQEPFPLATLAGQRLTSEEDA